MKPHAEGNKSNPLGEPLQIHPIAGDGNCWFRSISVAVTGGEEDHLAIRKAIVDFMPVPARDLQLNDLHSNVLVRHNLKYKPRQYSKHIKSLLRRKAAIWRKFRSDPSAILFDKYREIAQSCKHAIVEFDIERERRILNANNLGTFYNFVNNKIGRNHGVGPLLMNNDIFTSDADKANILNQYFETISTLDNNVLPDFPMRTDKSVDDINISPSIVHGILKKTKDQFCCWP